MVVQGFLTSPQARPFDMRLDSGASLAIMGAASTGKSRLLAGLCGDGVQPAKSLNARSTPQAMVKGAIPDRAAEALSALGLWDLRRTPIGDLSSTQRMACSLLPVAVCDQGVAGIDGQLDTLDLWVLDATLDLLLGRVGLTLIAVTSRPDIAARFGQVAVLSTRGLRAWGSPEALRGDAAPYRATVKARNSDAVRHVAKRLGLTVLRDQETITVTLDRGLDEAVALCLEGYADIEAVTIRVPTLAEVVRKNGP